MILGNYEVIKQIGEGGFGRTYEAKHIYLDEKACLKQNINISSQDSELLRKEAKLMWKISHYSLPAMRDFFPGPDGSSILVMDFIEGKTLDKIVEKHIAIHPEEVCWIAQRLLNGLCYLHNAGIVHGDIKPTNVIVQGKKHNAILLDYGLSCVKPTHETKPLGYTKVFAAPEMLKGKPPLPESDMYSLGLTLLFALGGDAIAKTYPSHVPKELQQFCNELIQYDPLKRPNWESGDLISKLSTVREKVFGRKSSMG